MKKFNYTFNRKVISNLINIVPYILLGLCLLSFLGETIFQSSALYKERTMFEKENEEIIQNKKNINSKREITFIDYKGIPISIKQKDKENIDLVMVSLEKSKKITTEELKLKIPDVDWKSGSRLKVPGYVDAPIILPKTNKTLNKDLLKGAVWNPETKKITEKGITFIQAHSGNSYRGMDYSYFDKLAMYYKNIEDLEAYIYQGNYTFKYRLEKKEIIIPGEKQLQEKDKFNLVLMTCYPRNTTNKRALFYFKLVDVYEGNNK